MNWKIVFDGKAEKQFNRLDRTIRLRIQSYLFARLAKHETPRDLGEPLSGFLSDRWKYRVGDYRIIAKIEDQTITIIVVAIGHRSDVYR
jgi:mRNA interferase RelE/StbE